MKTIEELIAEANVQRLIYKNKGRVEWPIEFKKDVIDYMYSTGKYSTKMGTLLTISESVIFKWKRVYGTDKSGYVHGSTVRHGIRSKCLAVKRILDNNELRHSVAKDYNVKSSTISRWIDIYENNYQYNIDNLNDEVSQIKPQEKMIYGNKNITDMESLLASNRDAVHQLLTKQHSLTVHEKKVLEGLGIKINNKSSDLSAFKEMGVELGVL